MSVHLSQQVFELIKAIDQLLQDEDDFIKPEPQDENLENLNHPQVVTQVDSDFVTKQEPKQDPDTNPNQSLLSTEIIEPENLVHTNRLTFEPKICPKRKHAIENSFNTIEGKLRKIDPPSDPPESSKVGITGNDGIEMTIDKLAQENGREADLRLLRQKASRFNEIQGLLTYKLRSFLIEFEKSIFYTI